MIGKKTVVYTSGTFDMLHINHLRLIEYARGLGDILIVGVNTDELVAQYKSTPMIPFEDRIALMRAIKGPDLVVPQHSLDHHDKVKKLKFDIFVVGDDWVGKYDYLEEMGVTVYWNVTQFLEAGNYQVSIFADGKMIGNRTINFAK